MGILIIISIIIGLIFFFNRKSSEEKDYKKLVKEFTQIDCELEKDSSNEELIQKYKELSEELENHPHYKGTGEG
jgi:hypothetical protein